MNKWLRGITLELQNKTGKVQVYTSEIGDLNKFIYFPGDGSEPQTRILEGDGAVEFEVPEGIEGPTSFKISRREVTANYHAGHRLN